jgi:hypothetical protein
MGLLQQVGQYIIREHVYKNITGQILTIGRQTIHISPDLLKIFLKQQGLPVPPPKKSPSTKRPSMRGWISLSTT